jgi:hypothetical protein
VRRGLTLEELLSTLPSDASLWADIASRFDVRVSFGIYLEAWNRGFSLSNTVVRRMVQIGASLDCDVYGPSDSPVETVEADWLDASATSDSPCTDG